MAPSVPLRTEPVELDAIAANLMAAGAVLGGKRVVRIVFELEDGGVLERVFAAPAKPVDPATVELTQQEEDILQTLEESDFPMTRKDVATRLHLDSFRGRFGTVINKLVKDGLVFERGRHITDDQKKFADSS